MTGILQNHARKYNLPIDELSFKYQALKLYRKQEEYYTAALADEEGPLDDVVPKFEDGVIVYGLFMEAMRWSDNDAVIVDSKPEEMTPVSHDRCPTRPNLGTVATFHKPLISFYLK